MCAYPKTTKHTPSQTLSPKRSYFKSIIRTSYTNDEIIEYNVAILRSRYISLSHFAISYRIAKRIRHPISTSMERICNQRKLCARRYNQHVHDEVSVLASTPSQSSIKLMLTLSLVYNWSNHTFDITTAFVHALSQETLCAWAPSEFYPESRTLWEYSRQSTD